MQMSAANSQIKKLKQDSFNFWENQKNNVISKAGNFNRPNWTSGFVGYSQESKTSIPKYIFGNGMRERLSLCSINKLFSV